MYLIRVCTETTVIPRWTKKVNVATESRDAISGETATVDTSGVVIREEANTPTMMAMEEIMVIKASCIGGILVTITPYHMDKSSMEITNMVTSVTVVAPQESEDTKDVMVKIVGYHDGK